MLYTVEHIDDYMNKITEEQAEVLVEHANEFVLEPVICAWYDDMEDFYQDWITDNKIFETEVEADRRYEEGLETGEFLRFSNGEIVRLVV